jgi:hypothetical protein
VHETQIKHREVLSLMAEGQSSPTVAERRLTRTSFCPHCRSNSRQRLEWQTSYDAGDDSHDINGTYYAAVCLTCEQVCLYHLYDVQESGEFYPFVEAELRYPDDGSLHNAVPEAIRNCYLEANRIRELAPNGFAVLIRRALEFLCDDQKAQGKTLSQKVAWLAKEGRMPGALGDMTAVMRLLGNIGAHASEEKILPSDALAIDGFFKSLTEYVYVAPHKLKQFEERVKEMGKPKVPLDEDTSASSSKKNP